jgi:DNA (cytosine-5)-methyltransferase 1
MDTRKKASKPTAIDLFCGSGAVSLGLKNAGFDVVGAVDFDPHACATYRANHPSVKLIQNDIRLIPANAFDDVVKKQLNLLVVCAPCQPFSSQNRKRSNDDGRLNLVEASLPFIERYQPQIVFLENVPGLASSGIFDRFRTCLATLGYEIAEPLKLDASELGVPQRRTRMIMVAVKGADLNAAIDIARLPRKTVRDVIADLPVPVVGRNAVSKDALHFSRQHSALNIERLRHIPTDGGSRHHLPEHLQLACHRNRKKASFSDVYGRMRWDDVAPTLTTGCTDITRGRFAHPEQDRGITLREAARLQSFPDDYQFIGNAGQVATQIGNAVPPQMMQSIAKSLLNAISSNK